MDIMRQTHCRICKATETIAVLDLGMMPLANAYISRQNLGKKEERYPLGIRFCPTCSLIQLSHIVDPEILYRDYAYMTSASKPLISHFQQLAEHICNTHIRSSNDLVVEIASNDGTHLQNFVGVCRVLGIEPAETVAAYTKTLGIETITKFFSSMLAHEIMNSHGHAKVVVANNVLAHIDNLDDTLFGVSLLLADGGVFIIEVHWVGNLVGDGGFDQIYHEHLSYFSLHALLKAAQRSHLTLVDAELVAVHGESLRVTFARDGAMSSRARDILEREKQLGLLELDSYLAFAQRVRDTKHEIWMCILRAMGDDCSKLIVGYGASAKGNTLLNYCGINVNYLRYIVDTTPLKQGRFTPGEHIPIVAPGKLRDDVPDYILLLAWNYAEAIMRQEAWFLKRGGKFIIPVPSVKIVGA